MPIGLEVAVENGPGWEGGEQGSKRHTQTRRAMLTPRSPRSLRLGERARLGCAGVELLKKEIATFDLPGKIELKEGIEIPGS